MVEYVERIAHPTSVKRIDVVERPTLTEPGEADFTCMDVYSVFDVGTTTPVVPLDNRTISLMNGFNMEVVLKDARVPTHYISLVTSDGRLITARDAISEGIAPSTVRVELVKPVKPVFREGEGWDYSMFGEDAEQRAYVHPIEFISRNGLPASSSVWRRIGDGELTLADLGLPPTMQPGDDCEGVVLDFSTKFEPDDRYLSPEEARALMSIGAERFALINDTTRKASDVMTEYAASRGFERKDGKIEFITYHVGGEPVDVVGDAVCTWHEDRLVYGGIGVSKQRIRDKEKELSPEWVAAIKTAKERAKAEKVADFRTLIPADVVRQPLPRDFIEGLNVLFQAATDHWVGAKVFDPYGRAESTQDSLDRAVEEFQRVQ